MHGKVPNQERLVISTSTPRAEASRSIGTQSHQLNDFTNPQQRARLRDDDQHKPLHDPDLFSLAEAPHTNGTQSHRLNGLTTHNNAYAFRQAINRNPCTTRTYSHMNPKIPTINYLQDISKSALTRKHPRQSTPSKHLVTSTSTPRAEAPRSIGTQSNQLHNFIKSM